jgi:hypothetical protein
MKILFKCPDCESPHMSYEEWESGEINLPIPYTCSCKIYCEKCDFVGRQYYKVDGWDRENQD